MASTDCVPTPSIVIVRRLLWAAVALAALVGLIAVFAPKDEPGATRAYADTFGGPFTLADPDVFENLVLAPGASIDVEVLFDRAAYTPGVNSANGVFTGEQVVQVTEEGIATRSGRFLPAEIKVWSAGIKAPEFLGRLDGLETNRLNQLVVDQTLKVTRDDNIFALGDCASCPQPDSDHPVPPRAQAAYQQAMLLASSLRGRLQGRPLKTFVYRDYGSLISLSYSSVGSIMGNLLGSVMLEGAIARLAYLMLYKKHQLALHGLIWVGLMTLVNLIRRRTEPRLKLH